MEAREARGVEWGERPSLNRNVYVVPDLTGVYSHLERDKLDIMSSQPSGTSTTGQNGGTHTSNAAISTTGTSASGAGRDKRTISELLDSLCSKGMRGPLLKALAESVGASSNAAQKYLTKHGSLPAPTVSDITKLMLASPEVSKAMEMYPVVGGPSSGMLATNVVPSPGCVEVFGTIPLSEAAAIASAVTTATGAAGPGASGSKKRKKKNKRKKGNGSHSSGATNPNGDSFSSSSSTEPLAQKGLRGGGVLRPRNFLEAALYFSSITMGTVEMASDLEPECFFAPPLLFPPSEGAESSSTATFDSVSWARGLQRTHCTALQWEQEKAMQRRVVGLFAVALLQTTNPNVKIGGGTGGGGGGGGNGSTLGASHSTLSAISSANGTNGVVNPRSNYLKRTIGLYAISLVDHLPPTLSTTGVTTSTGSGSGGETLLGSSTLSHFAPQRGASPILLANRKVDLDDLKVPSAHQLTTYWESLTPHERVTFLRAEMGTLSKSWINFKKTWCLCKYCRTRSTRLADVYEVLYRCYHDDLERLASAEAEKIPPTVGNSKGANERDQHYHHHHHQQRKKGGTTSASTSSNTSATSAASVTFAGATTELLPLKPKARRHFYGQLSELADDIIDERGYHYQMVMRRLGRAFEEDYDWGDCEHAAGETACDACRGALGISLSRKAWTTNNVNNASVIPSSSLTAPSNTASSPLAASMVAASANVGSSPLPSPSSSSSLALSSFSSSSSSSSSSTPFSPSVNMTLKDEYTDEEDDACLEHENGLRGDDDDEDEDDGDGGGDDDDDDDDLLDAFYEDFNFIEDEDIIQAESELPIDPAHLSTSFPHLYDPRLYTMPRPAVPAYQHHGSEMERQADGEALYERFASLLFQFHLVPRYLEAEALARQRRLWEEEEEAERLEKERAEAKLLAKQRKKERVRAAKEEAERLRLEAEAGERRRLEEERQRLEEEKRRRAEEQRRMDEQRRLEDIKRIEREEEERRRAAEEEHRRRMEEQARLDEEAEERKREEARKLTESLQLQTPMRPAPPVPSAPAFIDRPSPLLPPGLEEEEEEAPPPGLATASTSGAAITTVFPSSALSPPPEVTSTWFDKILQGPLIGDGATPLSSLWSPVSASLKLPPDEIPPGFSPLLGAPGSAGTTAISLDPHLLHAHSIMSPAINGHHHLSNSGLGPMLMGASPWSPFADEPPNPVSPF